MQATASLIETIQTSRKYTRAILALVSLLIALLPVFSTAFSTRLTTATIVIGGLILILEGLLIFPCLGLARQGQTANSSLALWTGVLLITGGIWLDVLATVWKTSDMAREGNLYIVFMRQNSFPLWSMYLVGFYAQAALTVISVSLWVAFLRHLPNYLNSLLVLQPQSLLEYLKAAFGGNTLYARLNHLKLSRTYRLLWLPVLLQIAPFARWELGLEWIGVLAPNGYIRQLVTWTQGIGVFILFVLGVVIFYFRNKGQIQRFDENFFWKSYLNLARSCGLGLMISICACCSLTIVAFPSWLYFTRPPDNLQVNLTLPDSAKVGELYVIEMELANPGPEPIEIHQLSLSSLGLPGAMETLLFVTSNPVYEIHLFGDTQAQYLLLNQTIAPGETKQITLYFVPMRSGRYYGSFILLSYMRMWPLEIPVEVTEP